MRIWLAWLFGLVLAPFAYLERLALLPVEQRPEWAKDLPPLSAVLRVLLLIVRPWRSLRPDPEADRRWHRRYGRIGPGALVGGAIWLAGHLARAVEASSDRSS